MKKLTSSLNISLNGHCGHEAGIHDQEAHEYFMKSLDKFDALLFGRKTFELFESYWPHLKEDPNSPQDQLQLNEAFSRKPKFVLSSTRKDSTWQKTFFLDGELTPTIAKLKKDYSLLTLGSVSLMSSLFEQDLMDELELLFHPLTTHQGPRLFEKIPQEHSLKLLDHHFFKSGVARMLYKVYFLQPVIV